MAHVPVEFQLLMAAVMIGLVQLLWAATAGAGVAAAGTGSRSRADTVDSQLSADFRKSGAQSTRSAMRCAPSSPSRSSSLRPKPQKIGKKEEAIIAAHQPDAGTPMGELMAR